MNEIAKKVRKISYLIGAVLAGALLLKHQTNWASGLMIGIIWAAVNFSLTTNLFEIALLKKDPKRVSLMLMIKFPVLYVAGFFLLKSGLFPMMSLLAGIGLTLFVIGIVNILPRQA